jgi:hypothetical protein
VKNRRDDLPLKPPAEEKPKPRPTPAPAWVALLAAWLGLLTLATSILLLCLPGSRNPRAELEHARPYSMADRFFPVPVYLSVAALFVGIVVFWQMRREPRPLPAEMAAQRLQAGVGIALALAGIVIFYAFAARHVGPGAPRA